MKKKVMSGMLMVLAMMMVFSQASCSSSKKKPKILIEKMEEIKNLHKKIHTDVSKFKKNVSSNKEIKKYVKEADKCLVYATKIFNDTELKMSDKERLDELEEVNKKLKGIQLKVQRKKQNLELGDLIEQRLKRDIEREKKEKAELRKLLK